MEEQIIDNVSTTNLRFRYRLEPLGKISLVFISLALLALVFRIVALFMLKKLHPANAGFSMDFQGLMFWANMVDYAIVAHVVFVVLSFIPFFMWLYRAYYNFEAIKLRGLATTSGWAVGYWFIPFANLYYMPTVLNEIWRVTNHLYQGNDNKKTVEYIGGTPLGAIWMACRILATIMSYMGLVRLNPTNIMDKLNSAVYIEVISNLLTLTSGIIIFTIVWQVSKKQNSIYDQN